MIADTGVTAMKSKKVWFSGPTVVYATTVATAIILYLMLDGSDITESSRAFLRLSGRVGMGLFFISFGASPLHRIFQAGWTRYLIRNRRYYGISTAIVLWAHYLVILSLSSTSPAWFEVSVPWFILFPGSVTFVFVGLMALSSNNFAVKKLGSKAWKKLHQVGGYLALSAFVGEYVLVLYLQPILLPDYDFAVKNSTVLMYALFAVPLLLLYLRLRKSCVAIRRFAFSLILRGGIRWLIYLEIVVHRPILACRLDNQARPNSSLCLLTMKNCRLSSRRNSSRRFR